MHKELERWPRTDGTSADGPGLFGVQQPGQGVGAGSAPTIPAVISRSRTEAAKDLYPEPQTRRTGAIPTRPDRRPHPLRPATSRTSRASSGLANTGIAGASHQPADGSPPVGPASPAHLRVHAYDRSSDKCLT